MKQLNRWKLLVTLPLLIGAVLFGAAAWDNAPTADNGVIPLRPPAFVGVAQAQGNGFPDDEVGIAAYFNAGQTINLNNASLLALLITDETPSGVTEYLIGSVRPDNYDNGDDDVHIYIHTDGWIMAYYHKDEVTSKIVNWIQYDGGVIIPTKLEVVLNNVANTINPGLTPVTPTHYHFAYPDADKMMLIAKKGDGNEFIVTLPDNFAFYETSWSIGHGCFRVIMTDSQEDLGCGYTQDQFVLTSNVSHTFTVWSTCCGDAKGGIALIYKEQ